MNVRKKVLAMLLSMSVLPLVIYIVINLYYSGGITEKLHNSRIETTAQVSASAFSKILDFHKAEIKMLSSSKSVSDYIGAVGQYGADSEQAEAAASDVNDYIKLYTDSQAAFENIVLVDENGTVTVSYNDELIGRSFSNAEYFSELMKSDNLNQVYISNVIPSPVYPNSPEKNCVAFSKKLYYKSGEVKGVIVAYVNTSFLTDFLGDITFGETGLAFIIDSGNYILYHNELRYYSSYVNALEAHDLHKRYKSGEIAESGFIYDTVAGEKRVYYYVVLDDNELILILREDYDEYSQDLQFLLITGLISILVISAAALYLALHFSKRFTTPILKLNMAFASGADSGKYVVCDIKQKDELGDMANSYNGMIMTLEKQFGEINEQKLHNEYMAFHDSITDLPNRYAFEKKLAEFISENKTGGVLFADIDNFNQINDVFGHQLGDSLLKELGRRLTASNGGFDFCGRINGDEFLLIKNGSEEDVLSAANQILNDLYDPILIDGNSFHITVGIGIAYYPEDGATAGELIHKSNKAMYCAKSKGKNIIEPFTQRMQNEFDRYNKIYNVLRGCIENKEIYMVYQPVIFTKTKKTVAFEALMRINSKELGELSPEEFIPVAESEPGIISKLGGWALENVCEFAKKLISGDGFTGIISINISTAQLGQDDFVDKVLMTLQKARLDPRYLQIEITENIMLNNKESNIEKLNLLREQGISVVMDDFGTNYSSFGFLMKLPLDMLKIDKSFVDDIENDYKKMLVIEIIIELAHILGFKVLAEGVEHEKQYDILLESDCDFIQGFYFSKPLSENDVRERIYIENQPQY